MNITYVKGGELHIAGSRLLTAGQMTQVSKII